MDISLRGLLTRPYYFVRGKIAEGLTPLEKKVFLVASLFFTLVTVGYVFFQYYQSLSVKPSDKSKNTLPPNINNRQGNHSVVNNIPETEEPEDVETGVEKTPAAVAVQNVDLLRSMLKQSLGSSTSLGAEVRYLYLDQEGNLQMMADAFKNRTVSLGRVENNLAWVSVTLTIHADWDQTKTSAFEWVRTDHTNVTAPVLDIVDTTIDELNLLALGAYRLATKNAPQSQAVGASEWLTYFENVNDYSPADLHQAKPTIQERLEKNRRYAKREQEAETILPKGFKYNSVNLPASVTLQPSWGASITVPLTGESKQISGIADVGIAWCQGIRNTMEDTHLVDQGSFMSKTKVDFTLFGLFDGHGGDGAAIFTRDNLTKYLIEEMESHCPEGLTEDGIYRALKECFVKLDAEHTSKLARENGINDTGTTATVALILDGKLWVANVGDSRTILVKNDGTVLQASEDAKPDVDRYRTKIEKNGGYVAYARVQGNLGVARAIGDKYLKGNTGSYLISPKPKITCYPMDFDYIVLACDGLYDVATSDEVGTALLAMQNESAEMKAKRIVFGAIENKSKDNVSVIVVKR